MKRTLKILLILLASLTTMTLFGLYVSPLFPEASRSALSFVVGVIIGLLTFLVLVITDCLD